jgi:hypothetical protein
MRGGVPFHTHLSRFTHIYRVEREREREREMSDDDDDDDVLWLSSRVVKFDGSCVQSNGDLRYILKVYNKASTDRVVVFKIKTNNPDRYIYSLTLTLHLLTHSTHYQLTHSLTHSLSHSTYLLIQHKIHSITHILIRSTYEQLTPSLTHSH